MLAFNLPPRGFANRDLRQCVAPLLGLSVDEYHRNRTTYDLRRLRLRGLVERIPRTNRYLVTTDGRRVALCHHRLHARVLRPAMSAAFDTAPNASSQIRRAVDAFDRGTIRLSQGFDLAT